MRALDNLTPQVHAGAAPPDYLAADVELQVGDVRDADAVRRALEGVDAVVHLAARVGVGQSMYEIADYTAVNSLGTAVLLEALPETSVRQAARRLEHERVRRRPLSHADGRPVEPPERTREQLDRREWELPGLEPAPTPETKRLGLSSIYALTKYEQERACLVAGAAYGIPSVALRLFNTYGTRQALSNPYTGVLAIFAARLLNDRPPLCSRTASSGAISSPCATWRVRSGSRWRETAQTAPSSTSAAARASRCGRSGTRLGATIGKEIEPGADRRVSPRRHPSLLCRHLAGAPVARLRARVELDAGLAELAAWLDGRVAHDRIDAAAEELTRRGLAL